MFRISTFIVLFFSFFITTISCQEASAPPEMVLEMPVPPKSKFFKEVKKGQVQIFKTELSKEMVVDFYKKHYDEKDASFFKKRDTEVVMVAGSLTRVIEIITKENETFISFSKFDL